MEKNFGVGDIVQSRKQARKWWKILMRSSRESHRFTRVKTKIGGVRAEGRVVNDMKHAFSSLNAHV